MGEQKTRFRPCIDLHEGRVKQIVGGTLGTSDGGPVTNFVSELSAAAFAAMYRDDSLSGGHVIMLGRGNDSEALSALRAFPQGLQIGGGINLSNASDWLSAGASHVIVTSALFPNGVFDEKVLAEISAEVGADHLVVDLSCRRSGDGWIAAMNRWQTLTDLELNRAAFDRLGQYCSEFLVHAADVEGLCRGIDCELVEKLAEWSAIPVTYAGGVRSMDDLILVERVSGGRVDVTVGSALDIFGGNRVSYKDCLEFNRCR